MILRCDLEAQYRRYKGEIDDAVARVLASGHYILGPEVVAFEREFAAYIGSRFAVGVANATDALTLALMALGVGPGDEVLTTPYTAIPTISAIIDAGATPKLVDICPDTYLMDLTKVERLLSKKTKAAIPVHIFGNVLDTPALRSILGPRIPIIEDASQSHGSRLGNRQSGSMGTVGVFSFYPTKNLGAYGDGGILVTDDPALDDRFRKLRMYGMTDRDHISIHGINTRLDEIQAAILRVKLRHLDKMNEARQKLASRYDQELPKDLFSPQVVSRGASSSVHLYVPRVRRDRRTDLIAHLERRQVQTTVFYKCPIHLQEATRDLGYRAGDLPATELLCEEALALPMYPELTSETQSRVLDAILEFSRA